MTLTEKAYKSGYKMGEYIKNRDGIKNAIARGSKAHIRYNREALVVAYNKGYADALSA